MHGNLAALRHTAVDPHPGPARLPIEQQRSRLWQEPLCGVFRVHTAFDRVPSLCQRRLRPPERLTGRHAQLRMHQVQACDCLGHGVLDLQPRIHLEEVEQRSVPRALDQELDGAGVPVAGGTRSGNGGFSHARAQHGRERRRRALLDYLLVPSLQRTLALEQVDDVAVVVRDHLDLDVPGPLDEPLDVQRRVAECRGRFAPRTMERSGCLSSRPHDAHADAAPTRRGLHERRDSRRTRLP